MDKLEHYLDRVCRGIAGPRSMRQHIRQELREHLIDAASEHENTGLSHEDAIDRAIEEFGGPDEVREQLEATHGHRLMTLVVDKAMQWKEKTMKAKWLWITWAHLALVLIIALEVLFIGGAVVLVLPRFRHFYDRGWIGTTENYPVVERWALDYFTAVLAAIQNWGWWVIPLALLWILFEWRARGENKSTIRLSLLGSAAVALLLVSLLTASFMILPMAAEMPRVANRDQTPDVKNYLADLDASLPALESAMATKDWTKVQSTLSITSQAVYKLSGTGTSAPVLVSAQQPEKTSALRTQLTGAMHAMSNAQVGAYHHDTAAVDDAIRQARALLDQLRPASRPSP
jgi:hypothetical protein